MSQDTQPQIPHHVQFSLDSGLLRPKEPLHFWHLRRHRSYQLNKDLSRQLKIIQYHYDRGVIYRLLAFPYPRERD